MVEHRVDVDGLARDRTGVAEGLHAVDELDDPVGLLADQPRERAVSIFRRHFKKLRCAPNTGRTGS